MSKRRTQILRAAVRVIAQDGVRGLRVDKLATEAGVSTALIYYHFKDRSGVLHSALDHINHNALSYTAITLAADPLEQLQEMLLLELQDTDDVRENSIAWGELRASAVFDHDLREALRATTRQRNADVEALLHQAGVTDDPALTAEHLTVLVEGLSERWHSGSITVERAREILTRAVRTLAGQ
ncbi:TetR/AcrR family transcriptional regulator [Allokutzneria sp. A3M-2-11 16]|uniref:TetR/AcrR family transcriptional regulator n=1 Tax=Allokutzneria sp. A3M-2-11 16 TaxID=2962043 RepID=UPI0020B7196D|nr:TetR/AcrR family transcriptional regulator [Allokutzneria sp. A3M-2-11 16]MCP3803856.1 TetR/AcrR family transcriptional regulator [Allokutzneria sp. A3M-2-11 16]